MSRKALLIALFASLVVNVFVLGAFAGMALINLRPPPAERPARPGGPMGMGMGPAAGVLSPEQRQALRAAMRDGAANAPARFREARMIRRSAWTRLGADTVDTQAVLADLARARELDGEARADLDQRLVTFATQLPPQDRKRFTEALSQPRGFGQRREGLGGRAVPRDGESRLPDR